MNTFFFFGLWNESFRKKHLNCTIVSGIEESRIAERPIAGIQANNLKAELRERQVEWKEDQFENCFWDRIH